MDQKNKKKIIIILFVIIALIASCILYLNFNNKSKNKINKKDTSLKENSETQQDCKEDYSTNNNNGYIYKVTVINKKGASVYDNYEKTTQKVVDTIENGKEIGIVADMFDGINYSKDNNKEVYKIDDIEIDGIKDYYYYGIEACGIRRYIKSTDVSVIDSSINISKKFDKAQKVYVYNDQYLYNGPGLLFDINKSVKISKGTILNVEKYNRGSNAVWLLVENENYKGWLLEAYFNTVNYPYNGIKGSAVILDETTGELDLNEETTLYRYPFTTANDVIILKIPSNSKVKYDYSTSEPGVTYYHINYNGNEGWIIKSI